MEPLIPLVTVAPPGWLWVATYALSGLVLLARVAALAATVAERDASQLSVVRGACVSGAGLLVGLALFGWLSRWGLTLNCRALLVSVEAVAVAFGRVPSLASYDTQLGSRRDTRRAAIRGNQLDLVAIEPPRPAMSARCRPRSVDEPCRRRRCRRWSGWPSLASGVRTSARSGSPCASALPRAPGGRAMRCRGSLPADRRCAPCRAIL
jgi:hypothetical protein